MHRGPSSSLYVRSQCSNAFFSETTWPFIIKLHIDHPLEGGTKVCINGQGHMTKIAAIHIYGKNLYKASSPEDLTLGMQQWGLKLYKAGINDDIRLTLNYFTAWSKLDTCDFEWEVCYKVIKLEKLQMTKLTEDLYFRKTLLPEGLSAPALGLYTCV